MRLACESRLVSGTSFGGLDTLTDDLSPSLQGMHNITRGSTALYEICTICYLHTGGDK